MISLAGLLVCVSAQGGADSELPKPDTSAAAAALMPEMAGGESSGERPPKSEFTDTYPGKLVPFAGMAVAVLIIWIVFSFLRQSEKLRHETINRYFEKGLEVPFELVVDSGNPQTWKKRPGADLRKGLVWLGIGLGLGLTAYILSGNVRQMALGLIFDFIGIGCLIAWKMSSKHSDERQEISA